VRLLDVGCGSGETLSLLSKSQPSFRFFGVDRSFSALRLAEERHPNSSARYVCADIQQLPFADDYFDAVIAFGIVEHIPQHRSALAEITRILRPGGTLYLSTSNAASFLQIFNRLRALAGRYPYGYQKNWTEFELLSELHPFFEIDRVFRMHADSDMPVVRLLDQAVANVLKNWSRYVCFRLRKRQR
jgi:ubiquinone/menaquinone biosynthesis C-methylase UbiE